MKVIPLIAAIALGGTALAFATGASAQTLQGRVLEGQPGWSCTTYRFVPGQQWICGQWSYLGNAKLAPPPGFSDQSVAPAKKVTPQKSKPRRKRRR